MPNILGVIPARYASTRFPGKPLIDLAGKSMIQRVYEQASKAKLLNKVVVATDDERILLHLQNMGLEVVMTSTNHTNGTERCLEALQLTEGDFEYVINIQGDEPFIDPNQIDTLAGILNGKVQLGTLIKRITDPAVLDSPNIVKVVFNRKMEALIFSRSCIPHLRGVSNEDRLSQFTFYKHIGIYAYRVDALAAITHLQPSPLEKAESLEQLRWLENGYKIKVVETDLETMGIDAPEDVEKAMKHYDV
ncbi:MAG: 3-deoxy-manno-octulosonate cytidylyltransferase [Imperialibacter sp.]|uniref:3-deoxy-manno-octulosonate cytidylyltransferase n=1 Tax=Imperialibacter sp. TaxID=2038411 RepID=UPI0032EE62F2